MARNCIILFILAFYCIYLTGVALAQDKEAGWQMGIVREMFNGTAIGRKHMRLNDVYYSDVCSWPELSCDLNLRITSLQLSTGYFSFTIPPLIGQLTSLEILSVQDGVEDVFATIPESFGNLTNLRSLRLGSRLYGTIPNSFENFKKLEVLEMSANYLNGTIPQGLATLPYLKTIFLGYNRLTGTIPDELVRGACESIELTGNLLTGSVPPVIYESSVKVLYLANNLLTIFPENTPRPPYLEYCRLDKNPFVCPIPKWAIDECDATCTTIEPLPAQGLSNTNIAIIISSASGVALVVVLLAVFLVRRKRRVSTSTSEQ